STTVGAGGQNDANDSGPSVAVIAVAVLVPLVTIAVIVCLVYVWYRRRYPVRMVFGKQFAVFSNPSYTKRSSTHTLVRDPNDIDFEKDIENGVRLTGVYHNRGLDISDEPQYQPTAGHSTLLRSMTDDTKSFDESPKLTERKTNTTLSPSGFSLVVDKRNVSENSLATSISTENETERKSSSTPDKAVMEHGEDKNEVEMPIAKNEVSEQNSIIKVTDKETIESQKVQGEKDGENSDKINATEKEEGRMEISSEMNGESETNVNDESDSSSSRQKHRDSDTDSDQTSTGEYVITGDEDIVTENTTGVAENTTDVAEVRDKGVDEGEDEDEVEEEDGKIEVTLDDIRPKLLERSRSSSLTTEDGELDIKRDDDDSYSSDLSEAKEQLEADIQEENKDMISVENDQTEESFELSQSGAESFVSMENTQSMGRDGLSSSNTTEESFEVIQPFKETTDSSSEASESEKLKNDDKTQESKDTPPLTENERPANMADESLTSLQSGREEMESSSSDESDDSANLEFREIKISPRPTRYSPPPKSSLKTQQIPTVTPELSSQPPQSSESLLQQTITTTATAAASSVPSSVQPLESENTFSIDSYQVSPVQTSESTTPPPILSSPPQLPSSPPPSSSSPPTYRIKPIQIQPNMVYSMSDQPSPPSTPPPPLPGSAPPLPSSPPPMFDDLPQLPKSPPPLGYSSEEDIDTMGTAEVTYHLHSDQDVFLDINSPEVRSDQNLPFRRPFDPMSSSGEQSTKFSFGDMDNSGSLGSSFSIISDESKGSSPLRLSSLPSPRRISVDSGSSYEIVDQSNEASKHKYDTKESDSTSSSEEDSIPPINVGAQSQGRRTSITLDNPAYSSNNYNIRLQFSADKSGNFGRRKSITLDNPTFDTNKEQVSSMSSSLEKSLDEYATIEASDIKEGDEKSESESPALPQRKIVKVDFQMESSDDDNFDADDASVHSGVPSDVSIDSDVSDDSDANTTHAYIINEED
ncbi:hypothetical protein FSP39_024900, partial [Pinctada imbricata]